MTSGIVVAAASYPSSPLTGAAFRTGTPPPQSSSLAW